MVRTQLYVDDDLYRVLKNLAARSRRTVSDLLREALRKTYGTTRSDERMAAVNRAFGVWKGRRDLGPTDTFIRGLRKGTRRKLIAATAAANDAALWTRNRKHYPMPEVRHFE